ncbi:MAG: DUF3182 family protein [Xanthobacteraceae bacterium]|nr:DUF3182 family protein [Xanthobacteraceae bacterium]
MDGSRALHSLSTEKPHFRTPPAAARGTVVVHGSRLSTPMYAHEKAALVHVASAIARLKQYDLAHSYSDALRQSGRVFFVPDDSLTSDEASSLGAGCASEIFGAIVPYPFVKTKAITHRLVHDDAERPEGWSSAFSDRVREAVLPGYTAFSARDAVAAARMLLRLGPVRLKPPLCCRSVGQVVANEERAVKAFLDQYPSEELAAYGLVLETNLQQVETLSVGKIAIDDMIATYFGVQRTTKNNTGEPVYGGSDLVCVRGDWGALEALATNGDIRAAIAQARCYDAAAEEYPGFLASRRNYDVGNGFDARGRKLSGVFEASWRIGGASTAELAALTAYAHDPSLQVVAASSVKKFGRGHRIPCHAIVHYLDDDPLDGPIARYTTVRTSPTHRLAQSFNVPVGPGAGADHAGRRTVSWRA